MRLIYLIDEIMIKGGTEKHLWDLAYGMSRRGHDVIVISLADGAFGRLFEEAKDFKYFCLKIRRVYELKGIIGFLKLISIIRSSKTQIVQTFHTASDLIGPLAAFIAHRNVISISSRRDMGYTKAPRHVFAQRLVNVFVSNFLANSKAVQNQIHSFEKVEHPKVKVIYNGIDTEIFMKKNFIYTNSLKHDLSDKFCIGTVANLRKVKGIHFLLEAAKLLENYPDIVFLIAGDGEERDKLEQLTVDLRISEKVHFLGWIENIPAFLSCLSIYIQPSITEGFSNSILEAMASELPVIATAVGGNKEIINDHIDGILIDPGDSSAIARNIDFLYKDQNKRREIAKKGMNKVFDFYSLSHMLNEYESFYASFGRH